MAENASRTNPREFDMWEEHSIDGVPTQIDSKCYDDDGRLKRTGIQINLRYTFLH